MRRLISPAALVLLALCAGNSAAQTQRLGIAAGTKLNLAAKGKAGSAGVARSYCLDESVWAPAPKTKLYQLATDKAFVKIGTNNPIRLSEAIKEGKVSVVRERDRDTGLGIQFRNNTAEAMEIEFRSETVFSDNPQRTLDGINLKAIIDMKPGVTGRRTQDEVWQAMFEARKEATLQAATQAKSFDELVESAPDDVQIANRESRGLVSFTKIAADGTDTLALLRTAPTANGYELVHLHDGKPEILATGQEALLRMVARFRTPAEFAASSRRPLELLTFAREGANTLVWLRMGEDKVELVRVTGDRVEPVKLGVDALGYRDEMRKRISEEKSGEKGVFLYLSALELKDDGEIAFQFGKTVVALNRDQLIKFITGKEIDRELDAKLRAAVEKDPVILMQDDLAGQVLLDRVYLPPIRVALELQRRYPKARAYLDDPDDPDQILTRVATISKVAGSKDVAFIHDPTQTFQDYGVFKTIEPFLQLVQVKTYAIPYAVAATPQEIKESNLVVLSGHKDKRFRTYVSRLAQSGVLKDKVVALFSCYERAEESFNSRLITQEGGAKAVLYFTTRIDNRAAVSVLQAFSDRLDTLDKNKPTEKPDLKNLLDAAIADVLKDPKIGEEIKGEIRKMNKAILQVSDARPAMPVGDRGHI